MALRPASVGWWMWRMLNGMKLPECEACTWLTVGCLCRRCMALYELERRDRRLDDDWGRPVACRWERSEWLMPCGKNFEEAAQFYESECTVECEKKHSRGGTNEAKTTPRLGRIGGFIIPERKGAF